METNLIKNINFKSIMKFTMPTIIMMVFMSVYQMVDGVFISNIIGTDALSAVNIVFPVISVIIGIAIMLGTGGSAVIAKNMGEGKHEKAKRQFTLITVTGIAIGIAVAVFGIIFMDKIVRLLGADDKLYAYCVDYLTILTLSTPLAILQMLFSCFFPAAGKPNLGLFIVVAGGAANIFFDYLFMAVVGMGIKGAAYGTAIGYAIPAVFGLIYFAVSKKGLLSFKKPNWDGRMLFNVCINGSSEMVTNLANGVTTFLFNFTMMKFLGADGVASITVALYAQFLLTSVYLGYSSGIAPVISYNYGRQDIPALKHIIKVSLFFIGANSVLWFVLSNAFKLPLIGIFAKSGSSVWQIVNDGWAKFAITFLLTGFNIFASSMFTAFSDGKTSALISFLRTFGFLAACILLLPGLIGIDGIWLSVPAAELMTLVISAVCFVKGKKRYKY